MKKILSLSLSMIVLLSLFEMAMLASAQVPQMADELRAENATGNPGDYVLVPVDITNVKNGPIMVIGLRLSYNTSVLNLVGVEFGDLTKKEGWVLTIGKKVILDTGGDNAMLNGSTGSIVLLNFSVIGKPGETSYMNLTDIALVNTPYQGGTAPAKNGTFSISTPTPTPIPAPTRDGPSGGGGSSGAPTDTDGDGLSDSHEKIMYKTDPYKADTDGGGVNDYAEVVRGTDPLDPTDDIVSTPTPSLPLQVTPTPSPAVTPPPAPTQKLPGFEAFFAIAGLLAVAYLVMRRR
jgi:PGF-CTERM protein